MVADGCGLLGGLTVWHIRKLTDNPFNGGIGLSIHDVCQMSLDQIWGQLCDENVLKEPVGKRTNIVNSLAAVSEMKTDVNGLIAGRDREGKPMRGKIAGKSVARQLMEKKAAEEAAKKQGGKRRR